MIVNFAKMHGLGNDIVVIDLITQGARLNKQHFVNIADRRLGIGCDQVILLTPPRTPDTDFFYRIYNSDGKEAEECVNGLRCAAKYFVNMGLTNSNNLVAECAAGRVKLSVNENIVAATWQKSLPEIITHRIEYDNLPHEIHEISLGNPHGVLVVEHINNHLVKTLGNKLCRSNIFSNGANIGFMQINNRQQVKLRVYERGAGLTYACGSGALAAFIVGNYLNLLDNKVDIAFRHGELNVELDPNTKCITMVGPASSVYVGRFKI